MPREVGDWTRDKLKILSDYLPAYLQATTRALERVYIDGFAGPGTNILSPSGTVIDGSPLIALNARAKNGTAFSRLYFIEQNFTLAAELEQEIKNRNESHRAEVIVGDVNQELPRIVHSLNKRSPTFVLLDTEGIEPRWETIALIADWQTELLINYPYGMAIRRNYSSPKVSAYFGTDEWRPLWELPGSAATRALLDLYKQRLRELGYKYTTTDDRLVKASGNKQLYYLVFVSKVNAARTIMNWVYRQPDAAGQIPLPLDEE